MLKSVEAGLVRSGFRPPWRLRRKGVRSYCVVSAVYNVASYLDDFFASLTLQSLPFEKHIRLVMVDDGSTDGSAEIIKRWQARYPRNIRYVRKNNEGQAAARNLGLLYCDAEWVTFIDPDDFVDRHYFSEVDRLLRQKRDRPISMVATNVILYEEATGRTRDIHPLRYKFAGGNTFVPADNPGRAIQLSAATAFFHADTIFKHGLTFGRRIRPAFEDAHFVGCYLLHVPRTTLCFAATAKYFYRKRSDRSSTIDTSWSTPARFYDLIKFGILDLLAEARLKNFIVPVWVQRMVLYELTWHLVYLVDKPEATAFLTPAEIARYRALLHTVFDHIDIDTIAKFDVGRFGAFEKIGVLGLFKNADWPTKVVYFDRFNATKRLVRCRYFSRDGKTALRIVANGAPVELHYAKRVVHTFLSETFVLEHVQWAQVPSSGELKALLDEEEAAMVVSGQRHLNGISVADLLRALRKPAPSKLPLYARVLRLQARFPSVRRKYEDAWLLMDREDGADDNAEHLYRYLRRERPEINAYYVLDRASVDWGRLEREGFRLIPFGSRQHRLALLNAAHLVSSHAGRHIHSRMPARLYGDMLRYRFTFLQHGVSVHDVSRPLNTVPMDLMTTATGPEHRSIVGDRTSYRLSAKEVVLTGFARHDALLRGAGRSPSLILMMPTWRTSLVGPAIPGTSLRQKSEAFYTSDYATRWRSLLSSERLHELARQHRCEIVFVVHFMFQAYADWFRAIPGIRVHSQTEGGSLQPLFQGTRVMVTDYSSVAFEAAYLDRGVIYYQFDRDTFFTGGHGYGLGYFDYVRDGFGPVVLGENELLDAIERTLTDNEDPIYAARRTATFPFRDGNNCRRICEAILALDSPAIPPAPTNEGPVLEERPKERAMA